MEDERQLQRNPRNAGTKDFIRHTSQVANPRCPKRFVPSFHVLLPGTSTPREFQKLREQSDLGTEECSAQCCKSRDCLLSFIEDEECYSVTGVKAGDNGISAVQGPRIDLQAAIIDRNKEVSRSLDDDDEDPDDLGSDDTDLKQKVKVKAKLQTFQTSKMSSASNLPQTKTNGSNVFKKKGSSQHTAHLANKWHGAQPSVKANAVRTSKELHNKGNVEPKTALLSHSKGPITPPASKIIRALNPIDAIVKLAPIQSNSVRMPPPVVTPPVAEDETSNPIDAIVKLATTPSSSAAKPHKRVSPSKAKYETTVKPTTKHWKPGTRRRGARKTNTGEHPEIAHDVKHLDQTTRAATIRKTSGANSKAVKTGKRSQKKSFRSSTAKGKWYIPRFTVGMEEGSSQDDEGSASGYEDLSGDNKDSATESNYFSGEDINLRGDSGYLDIKQHYFSGEDKDLSGDDTSLSGDDVGFDREHNDLSGDNKVQSGEDTSEINKDLMEDNEILSGEDQDLRGDNDDLQKLNHRIMQKKTYVGEDAEGSRRTKIDLVKDLEELGTDEDDSKQSNKENNKQVSEKVTNLPQTKRGKSAISKMKKNIKKNGDGQVKSKRVHFHQKQPHNKKKSHATNNSNKEISRALHGENKSKNDSTIATQHSQAVSKKHSSISGRSRGAKVLKETAVDRSGSGQKGSHNFETHDISLRSKTTTKETTEKQFKSKNKGKLKAKDGHKQSKPIKSAFTATSRVKPGRFKSSSGRGIKTEDQNKRTETGQSHASVTQSAFGRHVQSIKKYKQVVKRPKLKRKQNFGRSFLSRKTPKGASAVRNGKTGHKSAQRQKAHNKTMMLSQKTKSKSLKDHVKSHKQVNSQEKSSKSESHLKNSEGANTNAKHRKTLQSENIQEIHILLSKEKQSKDDHKGNTTSKNNFEGREKEGKLNFPNSKSTLEDISDLMHYAHRKVSLKHKPPKIRHTEHSVPTKKRAAFDNTTPRQQEAIVPKESKTFKNVKANHDEATQGKRPSFHQKDKALQKKSKSRHRSTVLFQQLKTESLNKKKPDKMEEHKSIVTTPTIPSLHGRRLSAAKAEDVSSKEKSNDHASTVNPRLQNTETNPSNRVPTSSNSAHGALLSIKQRSNANTSDTKANFLTHFLRADSNGSDGIEFSVKSHRKHHRGRGKKDEAIDVEDLGDADFDIMMSNDIPHKDLPKKGKGKRKEYNHREKGEEKEGDTQDDDNKKKKKRKKGRPHFKDEEHNTDSLNSRMDESEETKESTRSRHHHHHHHHLESNDADGERKEAKTESQQHHHKHEKSTNGEEKDSETKYHRHNTHKKGKHDSNKDKDDDSNDVDVNHLKPKHAKHHQSDAKEDDSENEENKPHRHHHKHKKHYDDNHWEGKIIPGKVKVSYEVDSGKKRHHKHHTEESDGNSVIGKKHHKRKHTSKIVESHNDNDEETEVRQHHRHSKEKALRNREHENDDDDSKRDEKHAEFSEEDREKHHSNDEHKKEKQERAEKRTDVNYEVVRKNRHRLVHNEDNEDDDNESSKSKDDDNDNDNDEKHNSKEDKGREDDDSDNSENVKHNRVVLGEDSESDDDEEDKHEEIHKSHNRQRHGNEHRDHEREDGDKKEDHRTALHNRHEQERHWQSKHKHEFKEESNEDDNDEDNERDNFRKSFIHHRKRKKQQRLRQHQHKERDREEEYNDAHRDRERQYYIKHHSHDSYKHHHHYKPHDGDDNKKTEKYEHRYEPKEPHDDESVKHDQEEYERKYEHSKEKIREYQKELEKLKESRFQENMKEERPDVESEEHNAKHYHEKEHHRGYISHEDDEDRKFEAPPYRHNQKDEYEHRFVEDERPREDEIEHRAYYNERRKYKPRHRKKSHWKHRHHFRGKEEHDFEGTGGLFDSSAWMRDENSEEDRYYGGEGNQEYHNRKHHRHKHRKHRQSYEYWAYGEQNPYYYDYDYYKPRPRYRYYKPQSAFRPPPQWHKQRNEGYDRWKPKPTRWNPDKEHWDRTSPWRQENRPTTGYQWHTFYSDRGFKNQPKPTSYPRGPSHVWPPNNPRWQTPDEKQRGFGGNSWPPGHGRGTEEQYNAWGKSGPSAPSSQDGHGYPPQQNPSSGLQPSRTLSAPKPDTQQQPTGEQSKYVPPIQPKPTGTVSQARLHPTVRRQYPATPPSQVSNPSNISQIKNIMDRLNTPSSAGGVQQAGSTPTVNHGPVQNNSSKKDGIPKMNLTSVDQMKDRNRLNGFFNEENGGKKKSEVARPANVSQDGHATRNSSSSANTSQHVQQTPLRTTNTPAKLPTQSTQLTNKTTIGHTTPIQTTSSQTSKPTKPVQNSTSTPTPTHTTTTELTPTAPNFGDVSQPDDSSETGKKHRKHRAPVCMAGKTTDDVTLLRGKRAGNFTNIGDVGDFEMCIKRCCQSQKCDLAFKSSETCFLVSCFSKDSCQTSPSLDDIFSPRMCFVTRHSRDEEKESPEQDGDDGWDDKVSPSGIREVCDVEKALGILWKKTVAGRYSAHPCPRGAQGFVKRRCEADSRWLPPDFSECVSKDYQTLFDKSKKLATGADPSPLIRELSQLTTQNIDNSLIFGGDLNRATDIMAAIVQHNGQTELLDMTREDVENFVRAGSNLLDMTNQQEWFNIQRNKPGTADVLRSMEMFALQAAMRLPREDMVDPTITNNIIIKLDRKSPGDGGLTFPDFSNPRISRWDARHDVIALPSSVFDRGEVSIASISFKSLPYLLPDSNVSTGLGPNSKVISTVLHPHPQERITPPVTVVLSHIKRRRGNPKCVFWDYTLNPHRGGAWSSRGCWLAFNNNSHSICQCSHLSNFAVLMDLSSDEVSQKEQKRERTMALMWIGIPVLIVGVIGGLYMSFSWNRKSGMPSTITRPSTSLNEKTGLLGQRVVTSQVREEFPASPSRDLYRALSPGYSPTGDLEWQDEFDFELEPGDQGFKQMLLPKLQMLQKQLINEFYDGDIIETKKKKLLESKVKHKSQTTAESPVQCDTVQPVRLQTIQHKPRITALSPVQPDVVHAVQRQMIQPKPQTTADSPLQSETVRTVNRQATQAKSQKAAGRPLKSQTFRTAHRQTKTSSGRKLRVRFADESPPGRNLTDEEKERFRRLQRLERRVFAQHLSRWTASSHLNLTD